jgi:hypothetical protein
MLDRVRDGAAIASLRAAVRAVPAPVEPGRGTPTLTRVVRHLLVLGVLATLALPASAAASPDQVVADCVKDGRLDRDYSNAELREARDNLPTDADEYSDCRDVIASAIKGDSDQGGGRGSPGVGGIDPAAEAAARETDAADLGAIAEAEDQPALDVGGLAVEPGDSGLFDLSTAVNTLPLPLLLALILFCALLAWASRVAVRHRLPALAKHPLLSKIPAPRVPFPGRR